MLTSFEKEIFVFIIIATFFAFALPVFNRYKIIRRRGHLERYKDKPVREQAKILQTVLGRCYSLLRTV